MKRLTSKRLLLLTLMVCACTTVTHAQTCEPHWSDQFAAADLDIGILALTPFDDGQGGGLAVYAGGFFTTGGDVTLNHIGKLEDNVWAPLGNGMDGSVWALAGFDDGSRTGPALIAGGSFEIAGEVEASNIAGWDGQSWSPLGTGLNAKVRAVADFDDGSDQGTRLFAGGFFTEAGGLPADHVARWDGSMWSPLGEGINGTVEAMTVFDDGSGAGPALYVGGSFTRAGGVEAKSIAKWDGEKWSAVGRGTNATVIALTVFDDGNRPALYAGGTFTTAGGVPADRIARWDGSVWSPVGGGMESTVFGLAVLSDGSDGDSALFAGGSFLEAGGIEVGHIAKWDGLKWSPLGSGVDGAVFVLTELHAHESGESRLLAGGLFTAAGDVAASKFAKWDGTEWSTTGNGMAGESSLTVVIDLESFDDGSGDGSALYAGGIFGSTGGEAAKAIAKWDGSEWSPVGGGMPDEFAAVFDLAVFDDGSGNAIFAGGLFQSAGGVQANNVAKWDGVDWFPLGAGADGTVRAFASYDDGSSDGRALYVGGRFDIAGGLIVNNVARWDGSGWSALGDGVTGGDDPIHGKVWAMAVFNDSTGAGEELYVGGNFTTAGEEQVSQIAKWDGTQWSSVGSGLDVGESGTVHALAVYDDGGGEALYAGGTFWTAGPVKVYGLAKWDGRKWSEVGGGTDGGVVSFAVFDEAGDGSESLFVAGLFSMAGGIKANSIARWNGSQWSPLGTGMGPYASTVWTMSVFDDQSGSGPALFAGGEFTTAGGQSSSHIAKWIVCPPQIPGDLDGDGIVGASDLLILLANWGPCDDCDDCPADLDDDCTVGASDLLTLLSNWG